MLATIWENVKTLPVWAQIVVYTISAIGLSAIGLYNNRVKDLIINRTNKAIYRVSFDQLSEHEIFSKRFVYKNALNNVIFQTENKNIIYKTYLSKKIDTDLKVITDIISDTKWKKLDRNQLIAYCLENLDLMLKETNQELEFNLSYMFGNQTAIKLVEYILNSENGLNKSRLERVNSLKKRLDRILRDEVIYNTNSRAIYAFATEVQLCLEQSIPQTEIAFVNMNGQLEKIINGR